MEATAFVVGYATGFVAKSRFCLRAIHQVQHSLEIVITYIATQRMGSFAGGIMGKQLSLVFTFPVTNVIGDIVGSIVAQVTEKVVLYALRYLLGKPKKEVKKNYLVPWLLSQTVGFCTRNYFSIASVERVEIMLTFIFTKPAVAYLEGFATGPYVGAFVGAQLAKTFTFPVAQFAGDVVGFGCRKTSLRVSNYAWEKAFVRKQDSKEV